MSETYTYDADDRLLSESGPAGSITYSYDDNGNRLSRVGPAGLAQYEFDFDYCDMLGMCDRMILFRLMSKHVARELGCIASHMPKPWSNAFGSGAHMNVSLADIETGKNVFDAANGREARGEHGYTADTYHFTAGVLKHCETIMAVACPTVNSYKRLNPRGLMNEMSWAPVYRAYGHNNRTLALRLPVNRKCLELRIADSATNFYLCSALMLAAGLEGIRDKVDPGEPVEIDTYSLEEEELAERGIHRLPRTLGTSIDAFAESDLAKATFGEEFHDSYTKYKRAEWDEYCLVVGEWEKERYLHMI